MMHLGCARQAGFDVTPSGRYGGEDRFGPRDGVVSGNVACLEHSTGDDFGLRARLKALVDLEENATKRQKIGPKKFSGECFHAACRVIQCLSWAWRWADWWVGHGGEEQRERRGTKRRRAARNEAAKSGEDRKEEAEERIDELTRTRALGYAIRTRC